MTLKKIPKKRNLQAKELRTDPMWRQQVHKTKKHRLESQKEKEAEQEIKEFK